MDRYCSRYSTDKYKNCLGSNGMTLYSLQPLNLQIYIIILVLKYTILHQDINDYIITFFMMILRIISFSLDRISAMDKKDSKDKPASDEYNWFNSILYVFYPTFVYPGLFISFTNFKECVNQSYFYSI